MLALSIPTRRAVRAAATRDYFLSTCYNGIAKVSPHARPMLLVFGNDRSLVDLFVVFECCSG